MSNFLPTLHAYPVTGSDHLRLVQVPATANFTEAVVPPVVFRALLNNPQRYNWFDDIIWHQPA